MVKAMGGFASGGGSDDGFQMGEDGARRLQETVENIARCKGIFLFIRVVADV